MSQKYIDWEMIEARDNETYKYSILRAYTADNKYIFKGFVVFSDGSDYWLEHESRDALRGALIVMGQQH